MDILIPENLFTILMISTTFSIIMTALIQSMKRLKFVNSDTKIWVIDFILSFSIGIPFCYYFYNINIYGSLWVAFFTFIGAPGIYKIMKSQNIINYTPKSLDDKKNVIEIPIENKINRSDLK